MRKLLLAAAAVLFMCVSASAQEVESVTPDVEVFGGYSYLRVYGEDSNGANVSVTGNVNRWFGITGDLSTHFATDDFGEDVTLVVGGPKFTYRRGPVTPYMHLMFGGAFGDGESEGAAVLGGGVDAQVSKHVAIRIAQVDYIATTFRSNNVRISTGIVFRFGER
jgi:peptidoglycan-associated lipoprotein